MRINHNIAALNTYRQLSNASGAAQKNMTKLSSGLRINTAGDDAAGLVISEKMRAQVRGLDQASRNAQDGISLIQTAEGALGETHNILQRMNELAVQAANDTNTTADRNEMQKEFAQLTSEVDRIANTTDFNTIKLLNGDSGNKVIFGTNNAVEGATTINDSIEAGSYAIVTTTPAERAEVSGTAAVLDGDITANETGSVTINGNAITFQTALGDATATLNNFVNAVNNANIGIVAANNADTLELSSDEYGASESITVTDGGAATSYSRIFNFTVAANVSDIGVDVAGTIDGVVAQGSGRSLTATSGDAIGLKVTLTAAAAEGAAGPQGSVDVTKNALTTHVGASKDQTMSINIASMTSVDLEINGLDISSQAGAEDAIESISNAIQKVSGERSKLGAYQNRLEYTINNLGSAAENLTTAESRIRDVDMAKEMMEFTKNNILNQAGQAMLAQANQQPQQILQLLR